MRKGTYYKNNPNVRKEYMQEYYRKNKERINERVRAYCKENEERRRERRKRWYAEHKDLQKERVNRCKRRYGAKYGIWRSKIVLTKYEDLIAKAKTQREKNALKKKMLRAKDKYMSMKRKWAEIRVQRAKERREARVQAKIDAWKQEVLDSNQISHENEKNSIELQS